MPRRDHFRVSARRRVEVPVCLRTADERSDLRARLVDVSLSGACLELDKALVPGVALTVEIRAPMLWDPLRLQGEVVWAKWNAEQGSARAGVRFEHGSSTAVFSLFELLSSQGFDT